MIVFIEFVQLYIDSLLRILLQNHPDFQIALGCAGIVGLGDVHKIVLVDC